MTQGPAMSTSGCPPPITTPPAVTGITPRLYVARAASREPFGPRAAARSTELPDRAERRGAAQDGLLGLVAVSGADECRKERMGTRRPGLEFRMELHREIPRMLGHLGDLHELAVRRPP